MGINSSKNESDKLDPRKSFETWLRFVRMLDKDIKTPECTIGHDQLSEDFNLFYYQFKQSWLQIPLQEIVSIFESHNVKGLKDKIEILLLLHVQTETVPLDIIVYDDLRYIEVKMNIKGQQITILAAYISPQSRIDKNKYFRLYIE